MNRMSRDRLATAGDGLGAVAALMARILTAVDECIADTSQGGRQRAVAALADMGLTKTAAIFGGGELTGPKAWAQLDAVVRKHTKPAPDNQTDDEGR